MSVKVSRILHAGYIFESGETKIAFDPIFENPFSRNCYAFPSIRFEFDEIEKLKLNALFISHFHDDHCSLDSLKYLDRETPIYIFCRLDEIPQLIRQLGFKSVYQIQLNQPIKMGDFTITPRRALDADVDSLFQIQTKEHNILNVVDSWIDWDTLELLKQEAPWDLILWPFQTMRELEVLSPLRYGFADPEIPSEWLEQLQALQPRAVVPSSCQFLQEAWSWYNSAFFPISYQFFEEKVRSVLPQVNVIRLNPGQSLQINQQIINFEQALPWIIPVGDQNVDYEYNQNLNVPSVAEIAGHFPELSRDQKQKVEIFLEHQILQIYQSLGSPDNDYFSKTRIWELRTYSAKGEENKYFYQISEDCLKIVSETNGETAWLTEIAESKIYSALVDGESLTSLYIRINNIIFSDGIESDLSDVDATIDPLVRCLFGKNPVSYQRAQLDRILKN